MGSQFVPGMHLLEVYSYAIGPDYTEVLLEPKVAKTLEFKIKEALIATLGEMVEKAFRKPGVVRVAGYAFDSEKTLTVTTDHIP